MAGNNHKVKIIYVDIDIEIISIFSTDFIGSYLQSKSVKVVHAVYFFIHTVYFQLPW